MENDAYEDVVRPALALAKLCLPMEVAGGALVAPGPAITSAYTGDSESENAEIGKLTTCYLGSYILEKCDSRDCTTNLFQTDRPEWDILFLLRLSCL